MLYHNRKLMYSYIIVRKGREKPQRERSKNGVEKETGEN